MKIRIDVGYEPVYNKKERTTIYIDNKPKFGTKTIRISNKHYLIVNDPSLFIREIGNLLGVEYDSIWVKYDYIKSENFEDIEVLYMIDAYFPDKQSYIAYTRKLKIKRIQETL